MQLQFDSAGFLIGERRMKELQQGVSSVNTDTTEILNILKNLLVRRSEESNRGYNQVARIEKKIGKIGQIRPTVKVTVNTDGRSVTRSTTKLDPVVSAGGQGKQITRNSGGTRQTGQHEVNPPTRSTTISNDPINATRDAAGRFVSRAPGVNDKSFLDSIRKGINGSNLGLNADTTGVDPTLDALHELNTIVSPAGRAFKSMGRGALWLYRRAKPKKDEQLPTEQAEHYTQVERHQTEQRRILRKMLEALNRDQNSLLGKLLAGAGLLSNLGRGGAKNSRRGGGGGGRNGPVIPVPTDNTRGRGKGGVLTKLTRKIPGIGLLVGGGLLASEWGNLNKEQKASGVGGLIGGTAGGLVGSLLGPVGSIDGATIGATIGEKVGGWTAGLQQQDLGGQIIGSWNKTLDGINKYTQDSWKGLMTSPSLATLAGYKTGAGVLLPQYRQYADGSPAYGGSGGGYSDGGSATPSTYNPKNEIPITKVLEAGKGYNIVELADGSVIKQQGNWNWRNRNVGNIERGNFTKSQGHLSLDSTTGDKGSKRFAAFPTIEAGRKAKENLIFSGKNYKNLTLNDAIYKYAPPHENNTAAYQRAVLSAVGSNKRMSEYTPAERAKIMAAIERQEGSIKPGKVTVLKPATKEWKPGQTATTQTTGQTAPAAKPKQAQKVSPSAKATSQKAPQATGAPLANPFKVPVVPPMLKKQNSAPQQKQVAVSSQPQKVSQNVQDRSLAHALTGGLGMKTTLV